MSTGLRLVAGLDLLQRSIDHTCAALGAVRPRDLPRPTPCAGWDVADLLAHMEDGLAAFTEAAGGTVALRGAGPTPPLQRVDAVRALATRVVAAWLEAGPDAVAVGEHPLAADAVTHLAALEVVVHGWDLDTALGRRRPLPEGLALDLLPTATALARTRGDDRFAPPLPAPPPGTAVGPRLLALLGRTDEPMITAGF